MPLPRQLGRLHPWVRAYGFVHDAYDVWEWYRRRKFTPQPAGWVVPGGAQWICGGFGDTARYGPGSKSGVCGLLNQGMFNGSPRIDPNGWKGIFFYDTRVSPPYNPAWHGHIVGQMLITGPAYAPLPALTQRPAPEPFVPLLPRPSDQVAPQPRPQPAPSPRPASQFLKSEPPREGQHERKGQVHSSLGKAVAVAFAATEGIDAVDALWDALPDSVKKQTPKSGRARKGAFIGEGTAYSTPIDKALHLWKHLRSLNLSQAAINLLMNHYIDKIIGTMSAKGADKLRKQLGAAGWGNVI